jgi:hypothetical protein
MVSLSRLSCFGIVRFFNVVWHFAVALETVRKRSQRSSVKLIDGVFSLFLFMAKLVKFPEICEAILATEVGWLQFHFKASWALHASWEGAVRCCAATLLRL